jgi:uncharacterized protein with NRDE domain
VCFVVGSLSEDPEPTLRLASNRDEFYNRQGEPPALRNDGGYDFVCPKDPQGGGTWFGLNEAGLIVALTNRLDSKPLTDAPSRGTLVRRLLSDTSGREQAVEHYRSLDLERFNPHRVILLDSTGLSVYRHTLDSTKRKDLDNGLFYLDNHSGLITDDAQLRKTLPVDPGADEEVIINRLAEFCASHEDVFERDSVCLHLEIAGTLSSSLLEIDPAANTLRYRFTQGQPCENPAEGVSLDDSFRNTFLQGWG